MRSHRLRAAAGGETAAIIAGATLHWDFGDTNCWNRTSSGITDLTGNGNNGTLYNYGSSGHSYGYSSSLGGHLVKTNSNNTASSPRYSGNGIEPTINIFRRPESGGVAYFGASSSNQIHPFTFEFICNADFGNPNSGLITDVNTPDQAPAYVWSDGMDFTSGFMFRKVSLHLVLNTLQQQGFSSGLTYSPGDNSNNFSPSQGGTINTNSSFTYSGQNTTPLSTGWEQLIITRTVSGSTYTTNMYRNKTLFYTATNNINYYGNFVFGLTERWLQFTGKYGIVRGYNKSFSQADVDSQYNAQKSRFGLP